MEFIDLLDEFNVQYITEGHHHCRAGWVQVDCPFCGKGTNKFHMGYSLEHGYGSCWRCGSHPIVTIVATLCDIPYKHAKVLSGKIRNTSFVAKSIDHKLVIPEGVGNLKRCHGGYLRGRGFDTKELKQLWGIQGIGSMTHGGCLSMRIFIPIYLHGEVVSWTTRTILDDPHITRYISASAEEELIPHRHLLYGMDFVRDVAYITEGPFDVWRIGPGGVGTFGMVYTPEQLLLMSMYKTRVIVFDNQPQAQQKAKKLMQELKHFPGDTYNVALDAKDPGEATDLEIQELREYFGS